MSKAFFDRLMRVHGIVLTDQQKRAVTHVKGPAINLATPGSGKTTTMVVRTAYLILEHGVNPNNILAVTFSRAAAQDMQDRFNKLFGNTIEGNVKFSTIHSLAYQIVMEYARKRGIKYTILENKNEAINKTAILKNIYHRITKDFLNDDKLEALETAISYVKNMMIPVKDFYKHDFKIDYFEEIYELYEKTKIENNFLDFDDMLTKCYDILIKDSSVLNRYRNMYHYVMLDEGQDTSYIQHKIVRLLVYPHNNLFLVADDDQSIYSWRGAYSQALLNFQKDYPGAKVFFMEQNFRSTKSIVKVANEFIKANIDRYKKNMFTTNNISIPIEIIAPKDTEEQTEFLINQLIQKDTLRDTAILYRNNNSAITIADAFDRLGIPFYIRDPKQSFFTHWVTQDICSFIRLAIDPTDIESFEKIFYKMRLWLKKEVVAYVKAYGKGKPVLETVLEYPELTEQKKVAVRATDITFKKILTKTPRQALEYIGNALKYRDYLEDEAKRNGNSIEHLLSILDIMKMLAKNTESLHEFLFRIDELKLVMEQSRFNKYRNAVAMTTIHSSKGLEYETVYMIDLIDEQFPSISSIESLKQGDRKLMEEERRLFYVGMTRAKKYLYLLAPQQKDSKYLKQSRFVDEVERISTNESISQLAVGSKVMHNRFGVGIVLSLGSELIEIDFGGRFGKKTLSLNLCYEKSLLKPVT